MIKKYLSLVKFSHTIFALPFAMIGFFLGVIYHPLPTNWNLNSTIGRGVEEWPGYVSLTSLSIKFFLVLLCMIFARSAAMAFNRWLDKNFDAKNPRTAIREIPAGIISANSALLFVIFNCIAFIVTTYFINTLCFYLSFLALFVILFYSYTKRFTALCHLVLGAGLSLAPIGAYLAVTGTFNVLPVLFSLVVICWVSGFDIIYALQDVDFDKSQQLHSIPVWLGKKNGLLFSEVLHSIVAVIVIIAGVYGHFHWLYWIGTAIFCSMLFYQHSIVKPNDLRRVNIAFMTANGIASVAFAIFVIADLLVF
ncbi:MAG: UbiA-like polyprenyltransferase [Flavitalea sp.]